MLNSRKLALAMRQQEKRSRVCRNVHGCKCVHQELHCGLCICNGIDISQDKRFSESRHIRLCGLRVVLASQAVATCVISGLYQQVCGRYLLGPGHVLVPYQSLCVALLAMCDQFYCTVWILYPLSTGWPCSTLRRQHYFRSKNRISTAQKGHGQHQYSDNSCAKFVRCAHYTCHKQHAVAARLEYNFVRHEVTDPCFTII